MFDIKWIRDNPEAFDRGLEARGLEGMAQRLIALDDQRRLHVTKLQDAQTRRNAASKEIGKAKAQKDEATAQRLMAEVAELKTLIQDGGVKERQIDQQLADELSGIPNLPLDEVPVGGDEDDNVVVRTVGTPPSLGFDPRQHFELGEQSGLMDFEAASKISGSRFVVLRGALARLERALGQFMIDLHTSEFGYEEVAPPLLVRDQAAFGTANLPKFSEDLFSTTRSVDFGAFVQEKIEAYGGLYGLLPETQNKYLELIHTLYATAPLKSDRLWLIPTAEVSLTNLVRETILPEEELPKRFTALTQCFRSEAGSAGRDVRGMIRQHQFTKVELVSITTPEMALDEHERMTGCAEEVLKRLDLPFRTMLLCTGDMGFASRKTYDIEVWLPGQNTYREISSCSVCGDFQARRMSARYRPSEGKGVAYVNTLNGSGLAVGRALIAVMENYQQVDGSIAIPDVLRPYMGGIDRVPGERVPATKS